MVKLAMFGGEPVIKGPLPTIEDSSGRWIGQEELRLVKEVIDSGTLGYIYGSKVREFERKFAALYNARHAVAVNSGTSALHTSIIYLDPEPGDEIILSPITDMGTAIPILYQNAIPVFADIDPRTQNINPQDIERNITDRTKAIMVTHIFGGPADMDPIMDIADKHDLFVIEDCAQAHLAEYKGKPIGTIGHLGCFSFQQSKHITTGDGGVVISNEDERFGRRLRLSSDKGWPRAKPGRDHLFLAPNYHMTELQAAVGIAQLNKLPAIVDRRVKNAEYLTSRLEQISQLELVGTLPNSRNTYFFYTFRVNSAATGIRNVELVKALNAEGLPAEAGYPGPKPLYLYDVLYNKETYGRSKCPFTCAMATREISYEKGLCPKAEKACQETVVLPWTEGYEKKHLDMIFEAIEKVTIHYNKK